MRKFGVFCHVEGEKTRGQPCSSLVVFMRRASGGKSQGSHCDVWQENNKILVQPETREVRIGENPFYSENK